MHRVFKPVRPLTVTSRVVLLPPLFVRAGCSSVRLLSSDPIAGVPRESAGVCPGRTEAKDANGFTSAHNVGIVYLGVTLGGSTSSRALLNSEHRERIVDTFQPTSNSMMRSKFT